MAQQFQAGAAPDLDALIASDVDLVSICTPTPSHADIANRLMCAGKHVLCEKPISRTLEQAQSMINTACQTGVKLMVAHVSRYEVDHRKAKDVLARGDIGELRYGFPLHHINLSRLEHSGLAGRQPKKRRPNH